MDETDTFLFPKAATQYLKDHHGRQCSPSYLSKLRCVGGGPLFYKRLGLVAYRPADLDGWAQQVSIDGPFSRSSVRNNVGLRGTT